MIDSRSSRAALAAIFLIFAAGRSEAQPPNAQAASPAADSDANRLVTTAATAMSRSDIVGAVPVAENVELGIGRYAVQEIARPRTHMEANRYPTDVRRRDRGIAGMGIKLSF